MGRLALAGLIAFGGLQGTDLVTSRGKREANPVMRMPLYGQVTVKAGLVAGVGFTAHKHRKAGTILLIGLDGFYLAVVSHNLKEHQP